MQRRPVGSKGAPPQQSPSSREPSTIRQRARGENGQCLSLVAVKDGTTVSYPLLESGTLLIGRAPSCDLQLQGPLVSREHAMIHLAGGIKIEDLGSANGTYVRSCRLQPRVPVELAPGDAVFIGGGVLLIKADSDVGELPRFVAAAELDRHLETLGALSARSGVGLMRIRTSGRPPTDHLSVLLGHSLGPGALFAWADPGDIRVLLSVAAQDLLDTTARQLAERFRDWHIRADVYQRFVTSGATPTELGKAAATFFGQTETVKLSRGTVVVSSPAMRRLFQAVDRLAPSEISVLILGETGVGKDVVASAIHDRSPRACQPFVRVNCAALSTSLLETELFGHEAGAFTDSKGMKPGLLETAQGGTVFLDEVGELPLAVQAKLLHALEAREVTRVGGLTPRRIDVRFVSATNRNLEVAAREGTFRSDLYFRLNGFALTVPPLRERQEEIEGLARMFIGAACRQLGRSEYGLSQEGVAVLAEYYWPGNVRELKSVMDRAVLFCSGQEIGREDLSSLVMVTGDDAGDPVKVPAVAPGVVLSSEGMGSGERAAILAALEACAGNQSRAAKMLGMPRRSLVRRIASLDIPRPRTWKRI